MCQCLKDYVLVVVVRDVDYERMEARQGQLTMGTCTDTHSQYRVCMSHKRRSVSVSVSVCVCLCLCLCVCVCNKCEVVSGTVNRERIQNPKGWMTPRSSKARSSKFTALGIAEWP